MGDDAWQLSKARALEFLAPELDRSRAGGIDPPIQALCALINDHPDFYTTSSCSGRVVLFWQRDAAAESEEQAEGDERTKAAGGGWLYITHDEPTLPELLAAAETLPASGLVVFKQEPFLLHVRCRGMEAAATLYRLARECGLRESGVAPGDFPLCAIRSSALKMDAVVGSDGAWVVSPEYLALTVRLATEKMRANLAKLDKLEQCLRAALSMHRSPSAEDGEQQGHGVLAMAPGSVKAAKTALEARGWVDKSRRIYDCTADAAEAACGSGAEGAGASKLMAVPVTGPAAAVLTAAADDEAGAGGSADVGLPEPLGEWLASGAVRWLPALAAPLRARPPAAEDTPAARVRRGVASVLERGGCGKPAADRLLATLPSKWEKLGDLAMLPSESLPEAALAAAAPDASQQREIWGVVRAGLGVQRLARQAAVDSGVMRQSRAVLLDAQDGADGWVTHRENGITYIFDATKVMFSSGNGSEKMRVAKLDCSDEVVLDLYAGIGYFTLPLLVHARAKHLHACELNPDSIEALRRGLAANGVADRCTVYPGDNQANAPALAGKCDRVHLGLIPSSELGWPLACAALRRDTGGVLHVHANVHKAEIEQWTARLAEVLGRHLRESDAPEPEPEPEPATASAPPAHPAQRAIWAAAQAAEAKAQARRRRAAVVRTWEVEVTHVELVKWYAPKIRHVVADVRCTPAVAATAPTETKEKEAEDLVCRPAAAPASPFAPPAAPPPAPPPAGAPRPAQVVGPHAWTAGCACCTPGGSDGRGKLGPMF